MMKFSFDTAIIGMKFELAFTVDSKIHQGFIDTFNDKNPIHLSDGFAESVGYKGKVMHGNILNGFISYFVGESQKESHLTLITQSIRYKNPVYLNNVLKLKVQVKDLSEAGRMYLFVFEFENENLQIVADGKFQCYQMLKINENG